MVKEPTDITQRRLEQIEQEKLSEKQNELERPVKVYEFNAELEKALTYINENFTKISQAYNQLVDRIHYINNLGEVLIEALIDTGILTLEDLQKAKEKLEQQALAELENQKSTGNSEEEKQNE